MFQVQSSSTLSPSPTISCFSDLVLVSAFPAIDSVLSPKSPFPLPPVNLSLPDQQSFHQVSRFSKVVTDSRLAASTLDYFSLSEFITRCTARPLSHRLPFRLSLTTTQFRHSRFWKVSTPHSNSPASCSRVQLGLLLQRAELALSTTC